MTKNTAFYARYSFEIQHEESINIQELTENGVKLLSTTENLDSSPESLILESILEEMANYYTKDLAQQSPSREIN